MYFEVVYIRFFHDSRLLPENATFLRQLLKAKGIIKSMKNFYVTTITILYSQHLTQYTKQLARLRFLLVAICNWSQHHLEFFTRIGVQFYFGDFAMAGSDKAQDDRQNDKAVVHGKHNHEEKYLEGDIFEFFVKFRLKNDFYTLKKVRKTCEFELAQRIKEKKVLRPPFRTAGPIFCSANCALTSRDPGLIRNSWVMWAAESTQRPMQMMRLVQDTVSMVRPQKCMNPATLIMVRTTLRRTSMQAMKSESNIKVVTKMQQNARAMLR